ncbi:hypothetical protein LSUE1_G000099 [Lachnellula suecica]|uniref:Flavin-nucleotide-binding protein n=1 Tax=Lachnellula suecica TaxID=602035 RepID=A0A8T9CI86_9HELO|nr:hypothetical protein LSUE1_G000099 [Lachnellula suecica]
MADSDAVYPKVKLNSVNRLRNRGKYDFATIHGLVNKSPVVHVSFASDPSEPFPTILPMIGQMGSFQDPSAGLDSPLDCYLHGYVSSRIMRLSKEAVARGEDGLPVCVTATKVDGYVLALAPFHHSYNYRSAVLHGYAQPVEDDDERVWAMELVTNSVVPERWENSRTPPTKTEMTSTTILRVKIHVGSAKLRSGGPHDDRFDLKDESVRGKYWAGVVPLWEVMGEPIASGDNSVAQVPGYLRDYVQKQNDENKEIALNAARE